jgi:hypothetical protein
LSQRKSAGVGEGPRPKDLHAEGSTAVGELPLVLKAAAGVYSLEGSDSHDEIIHKLNRQGFPPSIDIGVPLIVYHLVFVGALNFEGVEYDHAEMHAGDHSLGLEGGVELVELGA